MFKIFSIILIYAFTLISAQAFDIRSINNNKIISKAAYDINDTNLVDIENAENLFKHNKNTKKALTEKQKELIKNNKNRSQPKYKGGAEELYDQYINSVVFIGNLKNNRLIGMGSGFVIKDKGKLKIITNWHVIDGADSLKVWLKPEVMVDENYLINEVDSYSAKIINTNETKDLAILKVEKLPLQLKPVNYGKFRSVRPGQTVFAMGHPEGLLWTFSPGYVNQVRPNYKWIKIIFTQSKCNSN